MAERQSVDRVLEHQGVTEWDAVKPGDLMVHPIASYVLQ